MVLTAPKRMRRGTKSSLDNGIFYINKYDLSLRDFKMVFILIYHGKQVRFNFFIRNQSVFISFE